MKVSPRAVIRECMTPPEFEMALTREFKETIQARVRTDRAFRSSLLRNDIEQILCDDVDAGKTILREYIEATVGFERLDAEAGASAKRLIRMFGPRRNPQARNLFAVISHVQRQASLALHVTAHSQ